MKTLIDNTERVFLVTICGTRVQHYFSNLIGLPEILEQNHNGARITVKHFWNEKFYRISKSDLNNMFYEDQINFRL